MPFRQFIRSEKTTAMRHMLEDIGISEQAMRYEEFHGY
jgi:hypothetical protein